MENLRRLFWDFHASHDSSSGFLAFVKAGERNSDVNDTRSFNMTKTDLFDEVRELPDPVAEQKFSQLVGLDQLKELLLKEGQLLLVPELLDKWCRKFHGTILPGVKILQQRSPLIVFSGDVGTGKTTLADSFGDSIARKQGVRVTLFRLSLITRGRGAVGEMTSLISRAFGEVEDVARRGANKSGKARSAVILVIDEADALAESRATEQMHHEDRAGVNALIRGIDRFARNQLPALVVLCTNRHETLDPAVLRRAAIHHKFDRPTTAQTEFLLRAALKDIFDDKQYRELAKLLGPERNGRVYGFTFSDVAQRFVPSLLLEAFPDRPVTFELALSIAKRIEPTQPFGSTIGETR